MTLVGSGVDSVRMQVDGKHASRHTVDGVALVTYCLDEGLPAAAGLLDNNEAVVRTTHSHIEAKEMRRGFSLVLTLRAVWPANKAAI
ncbi:hypothetical protein [Natrinema salsiterrestre]|uniref:Uncharacterized protein n=1 Tax=Natrinema salsiterrestre TaxID=2950540 RepID=A0A9Q4Q3H9_9EURY|nr:hypothetical protein [Natrinema salsiterrestre]MDF9746177.1 hypothetical protein [Natrinema salsiterrestre]